MVSSPVSNKRQAILLASCAGNHTGNAIFVGRHVQILQHALNLCITNVAPVQEGQQVQESQHGNQPEIHLAQEFVLGLPRVHRASSIFNSADSGFLRVGRGN